MMGRRSTFFLTIMTAFVGFGLFHIKYDVMRLEKEYRQLCQLQLQAEESIRILRAEWAHLNTPERLARLCAKHLPVQQPAHAAQLFSVRFLETLDTAPSANIQEICIDPQGKDQEMMVLEETIHMVAYGYEGRPS